MRLLNFCIFPVSEIHSEAKLRLSYAERSCDVTTTEQEEEDALQPYRKPKIPGKLLDTAASTTKKNGQRNPNKKRGKASEPSDESTTPSSLDLVESQGELFFFSSNASNRCIFICIIFVTVLVGGTLALLRPTHQRRYSSESRYSIDGLTDYETTPLPEGKHFPIFTSLPRLILPLFCCNQVRTMTSSSGRILLIYVPAATRTDP